MAKIRNLIFRGQKGIGLLELMLSLAIIAILLVMATRYYLTTSQSQKVNEMISLTASIQSAAAKWNRSDYKELTVQIIHDSGWVPPKYFSSATQMITPWGTLLNFDSSVNNPDGSSDIMLTINTPSEAVTKDLTARLGGNPAEASGKSLIYYVVSQSIGAKPKT